MKLSELKAQLGSCIDGLAGLEAQARKLRNQNLADVISVAGARARQTLEHPDLILLSDDKPDEQLSKDNACKAEVGLTLGDQRQPETKPKEQPSFIPPEKLAEAEQLPVGDARAPFIPPGIGLPEAAGQPAAADSVQG